RAVDVCIDLGRRDVGMPEQRLEHPKVRAAREKGRRKGVSQNMRAHSVRRDSSVRGHLPDDLEQPHSADMALFAWEQPQTFVGDVLAPGGDRRFGARGDRDEALLAALAAEDQERLAGANSAPYETHRTAA